MRARTRETRQRRVPARARSSHSASRHISFVAPRRRRAFYSIEKRRLQPGFIDNKAFKHWVRDTMFELEYKQAETAKANATIKS